MCGVCNIQRLGQREIQSTQQGVKLLRLQDGRLYKKGGRSGGNQRGVVFDELLDRLCCCQSQRTLGTCLSRDRALHCHSYLITTLSGTIQPFGDCSLNITLTLAGCQGNVRDFG
jgi:hypothetical protein